MAYPEILGMGGMAGWFVVYYSLIINLFKEFLMVINESGKQKLLLVIMHINEI